MRVSHLGKLTMKNPPTMTDIHSGTDELIPPPAVNFVNAQIEGVSEKETRLQEKQWAIEDQINELQKQTYDAETIFHQLEDFVANFPDLDQGGRKLLVESLVEGVEIGKNKRVAASLRPPFGLGFISPDLAPRGIEPLF